MANPSSVQRRTKEKTGGIIMRLVDEPTPQSTENHDVSNPAPRPGHPDYPGMGQTSSQTIGTSQLPSLMPSTTGLQQLSGRPHPEHRDDNVFIPLPPPLPVNSADRQTPAPQMTETSQHREDYSGGHLQLGLTNQGQQFASVPAGIPSLRNPEASSDLKTPKQPPAQGFQCGYPTAPAPAPPGSLPASDQPCPPPINPDQLPNLFKRPGAATVNLPSLLSPGSANQVNSLNLPDLRSTPSSDLSSQRAGYSGSWPMADQTLRRAFTIFQGRIEREEIPTTVSKHWLVLEDLKYEARYNPDFLKFVKDLESEGFVGWKRCRGDGNCYFRSVVCAYMEQLLRPYTDVTLTEFISRLQSEERVSPFMSVYADAKTLALELLMHLEQVYRQNPIEAFIQFQKMMQVEEYDKAFVNSLKMLAADFVITHQSDEEFMAFLFEGVEDVVNQILKENEEAEELTLVFTQRALNIQICQYHFFSQLKKEFFPHEPGETVTRIHIVIKLRGHYDILYHSENQREDGYDFNSNSYNMRTS